MAPLVLGIVLGDLLEKNLRKAPPRLVLNALRLRLIASRNARVAK